MRQNKVLGPPIKYNLYVKQRRPILSCIQRMAMFTSVPGMFHYAKFHFPWFSLWISCQITKSHTQTQL